MRLLPRVRIDRRAALAMTLCACRSGAPAPSNQMVRPVAMEWTGDRALAWSPPASPPIPTKGTWVLHVGDSFVDAYFSQNLRKRFDAVGARQVAVA